MTALIGANRVVCLSPFSSPFLNDDEEDGAKENRDLTVCGFVALPPPLPRRCCSLTLTYYFNDRRYPHGRLLVSYGQFYRETFAFERILIAKQSRSIAACSTRLYL
jgi:hypothetical protein